MIEGLVTTDYFLPRNYKNSDQYKSTLEYGRSIITQRGKNARNEIIIGYGEVGQLIYNDPLYKKYGHGNNSFVTELFKDLGIGHSTGYACIQYYEKFVKGKYDIEVSDSLESFNDGITWSRIVKEYLPEVHHTEVAKQEDVADCHCVCHTRNHAA